MNLNDTTGDTEPDNGTDWFGFAAKYAAPIFLVGLILVFALLQPNFLHPLNLLNVLRQVSISGLIETNISSDKP